MLDLDRNFAAFRETVTANAALEHIVPDAQQVDIATMTAQAPGGAEALLTVRRRGGYILDLNLVSGNTETSVPVLYCEADRRRAKLKASHAMTPVGPAPNDPGGQHGFPRWVDYELTENVGMLDAYSPDFGVPVPRLAQNFQLDPDRLVATRTLYNRHDKLATSMGSHDYYRVPRSRLDDVRICGTSIGRLLHDMGATDKIRAGEALFWEDFEGRADVDLPTPNGDRRLHISATATVDDESRPVRDLGLLIWRGADTEKNTGEDYLCIEPTIGLSADEDGVRSNTGLIIPRAGRASFRTTIQLL